MSVTDAQQIGAIAVTMFAKRNLETTYGMTHPGLAILASEKLSKAKEAAVGKIEVVTDKMGKVEKLKWRVSVAAPANGGAYTRGSSTAFTFAAANRWLTANVEPAHLDQPIVVPTSDIDTRESYNGTQDSKILELADAMTEAKNELFTIIAHDTFSASTTSNSVTAAGVHFASTGTSCGIAQSDQATWIANVVAIDDRLTLSTLGAKIRLHKATKGGNIDVVLVGHGVHDKLVTEYESKNLTWVNVAEHFGTTPGNKGYGLYLESSLSCIKCEGAIIIPDNDVNHALSTTALGFGIDNLFIKGAGENNFRVKGWQDAWAQGADETRGLVLWSGNTGCFNRSRLLALTGCTAS